MISAIHVYDMRDAPAEADRQVVLRLVDEGGCMAMQGLIFGDDPRAFAGAISERLGVELRYHGPAPAIAEEPRPAVDSRIPDFVTECERCGCLTGVVSGASREFVSILQEWSEQGMSSRQMNPDDVKQAKWCKCGPRAKQKALF